MSNDFVEDAIDSLQKHNGSYLLIAAQWNSPDCFKACRIPTRGHLEWMKRRFSELCTSLEERYDSQEENV